MSRAAKKQAEENCIPAYLLYWIFNYMNQESGGVKDYGDAQEKISNTLQEYITKVPVFYKDQVKHKCKCVCDRVTRYFVKQKYDSAKVFMILHNLIYKLADEEKIEIFNEGYKEILERIDGELYEYEEKGVTLKDGSFISQEDAKTRYSSAEKQAKRLRKILEEEGYYAN